MSHTTQDTLSIAIGRAPFQGGSAGHADPGAALRTVEGSGSATVGEPRGKPKHSAILGRAEGGDRMESHIEIDGPMRKSKPVPAGDETWGKTTWTAD